MGGIVQQLGGAFGGGATQVGSAATNPQLENLTKLDLDFGKSIAEHNAMTGPQEQFRSGQADFIKSLQEQAAGAGPSLAQEQLKSAQDRAIQQQMALMGSARGLQAGSASRALAGSTAAMQQGLAGQAAQARMQEQLNAQQMLGGQLQAARGQDISYQQLKDQYATALMGMGGQRDIAKMQAGVQGALGAANVAEAGADRMGKMGQGILGGIGGMLEI